jgi:Protein of unknown function (DUF2637)
VTGVLRVPRRAALTAIAVLVAAASLTSFAESYRGLWLWAHEHGLSGAWAVAWPLQVDVFIAVGELALFVALADRWPLRSRAGAWAVTVLGLAVSVAGNVGHVQAHSLADRATAAVPPLAAAAALAVGLGVLKRVVEHHHQAAGPPVLAQVAHDAGQAAQAALRATVAAGNPLSGRQLAERFGLNRAQVAQVRSAVLAESNGHGAPDPHSDTGTVVPAQQPPMSPPDTAGRTAT